MKNYYYYYDYYHYHYYYDYYHYHYHYIQITIGVYTIPMIDHFKASRDLWQIGERRDSRGLGNAMTKERNQIKY